MDPYESEDNRLQKVQNRLIATHAAISLYCCMRSHGTSTGGGIPLPGEGTVTSIDSLLVALDEWVKQILAHAEQKEA